jgi:flagellar basal-body rod modification protein FlgD
LINTLTPGTSTVQKDSERDKILEKISHEYGKPEEKQREAVKKMGKDEFFKLLINQVQHQDPLKPYDNEQMAAQMAQFTALEQMVNMNQNIEKLQQSQVPLQNMGAANLIGKFVTVDSSRVQHTEGKYSTLAFELPKDATRLRISLMNDHGETVREFTKENVKQGPVSIEWDGKKENNLLAASGSYSMQIAAVDEHEKPIMVKTTNTQMVHGVGFEGKDTVLYTGDLTKPQKMMLKDVTRIIDNSQSQQPGVIGGPGGLQIGGLQNLVGQGAEKPPEMAEERPVEGVDVGQNGRFTPVDVRAIHKNQEKPDYAPPVDDSALRRAAYEVRKDLSDANLAAQAVAAGKLDNNAARKSVPSGGEFSAAGKLAE